MTMLVRDDYCISARRSGAAGRAPAPYAPLTASDGRSALDMIADCFRHQHPEAFGRPPVPAAVLPVEVRYGRDDMSQPAPAQVLIEESMGNPHALALEVETVRREPSSYIE